MFLLNITFVLLLRYHNSYAMPIHPTNSTSKEMGSALKNSWNSPLMSFEAVPKPQPPRTLVSMAGSCILTIFICAWTSVHPNVLPQSSMGGLLARIKLMFWTIVAPELVLAWAVRQWFAAKEIRDMYNKRKGRNHSPKDNVNAEENSRVDLLDEGKWSFPGYGWLPTCG